MSSSRNTECNSNSVGTAMVKSEEGGFLLAWKKTTRERQEVMYSQECTTAGKDDQR